MIKFFRKIRYNLKSENKTDKYLKYAIGEIVLVVFGILIALWLNNLNLKNQKTIEEIDILKGLKKNQQISIHISKSKYLTFSLKKSNFV